MKFFSVNEQVRGRGGWLDMRCCSAVIYDDRYILIGRESVFRLVVAEAQTFVYITGGEMIPSSSIYPWLSH